MNAGQFVKCALITTVCAGMLLNLVQAAKSDPATKTDKATKKTEKTDQTANTDKARTLTKQTRDGYEGAKEACGAKIDQQKVKAKVPIGGGAGGPNIDEVEIEFLLDNCGSTAVAIDDQPNIKWCTFTSPEATQRTVTANRWVPQTPPEVQFKAKGDAEPQTYALCYSIRGGCFLKKGHVGDC